MPDDTPSPTECPPDEAFVDLLAGRLTAAESGRLERHVETCEACRGLLDILTAGATAEAETDDDLARALLRAGPPRGESALGRTLDRKYRILALLGKGGMGEVYEAEHLETGRRVAIKLIHARLQARGDEAASRFRREARAAGALDSPHVVEILDAGKDESTGDLYLVMPYLRGEDLQRTIDRVGPLRPEVALRIAAQALAGLAKAHEAGIVHRDLKPANLFLARRDGGGVTVVLLDFGIAKVTADAAQAGHTTGLTRTEGVLGSPLYMSPEQMQDSKGVDARTDLWSLGSALYCALAGRAPYRHVESLFALLPAIQAGRAPPLQQLAPWVSPEVAEALQRALAVDPKERYPSAGAMLEAIRALVPGDLALREEMLTGVSAEWGPAAEAARSTVRPGRRPWVRSTSVVAALVAVFAMVAGIAGGWRLRSTPAVPSAAPAASSAGSAEPAPIAELACGAAEVSGESAPPLLAQAIGSAACIRLALAVGVPWRAPMEKSAIASPVAVRAELSPGRARVTITVAGRTATAEGKAPVPAINELLKSLVPQLAAPVLTDEDVRAWGAKDGESARRIQRLWRTYSILADETIDRLQTDVVKEALAADPDAPWLHALLTFLGDPREQEPAIRLCARLPVGRAEALRGALLLRTPTVSDDQKLEREGLRLIRQGYAESPNDPEIAGLLTLGFWFSREHHDDLPGIADRIYGRSPADSVPLLRMVLLVEQRDAVRWRALYERIEVAAPDLALKMIYPIVRMAGVDAGRSALDLVRRVDGTVSQEASLTVLDPDAARAEGEQEFGDPSPEVAMGGAEQIVAADMMAGRIVDAESESIGVAQRFHESGADSFSWCVRREIRVRRWLGHPIPATERTAWLATIARDLERTSPIEAASLLVELAFAGAGGRPSKTAAEAALGAVERLLAKEDQGDPHRREDALAVTLPLVRAARGDAAAAQRWREAGKSRLRRLVAFDAGLALEAVGNRVEAEQAYLLAEDVYSANFKAFDMIAARVRRAEIYRAQGRLDEARTLDAIVDRVWAHADPGLREQVRRLK